MSSPTKADLTAAVAKLTQENAGLRDENAALRELLGAVQVLADAPKPADYSDRYYWACTDRLSTIAVWADLEDATGEYKAQVIQGWAKVVRAQAAKPVRYEVEAPAPSDDEYRITPKGEAVLGAEPARFCARGGPYVGVYCKLAPHAEGDHLGTGPDGDVTWPQEDALCGARPYPAGSEGDDDTECTLPAGHDGPHDDTPPGSGAPDWCPAFTVYDEDADHLTLYCDRERGHHGSHHAPGPDEGSEVAWSDETAASVTA